MNETSETTPTPPSNIRCRPWTRWQCHKIVQADKITEIAEADGMMKITMGEEPDAPVLVTSTLPAVEGEIPWPVKHKPQVGGYLVIYEDGYLSYSPAEAFEKGYRPLNGLKFGDAIEALKSGKRVCRAGWNGKGMWINAQFPDENSKMTLPYLYIEYPTGHTAYPKGSRVPWLASQTDMLSEDWQILD